MTDLCPTCHASLWEPMDDPAIMLRYFHLHDGKKLTKIPKFLPADPRFTDDDEAKAHGHITPSQELAIQMCLYEIDRSDGALIGDEPGFGKTAIGAELIKRAGWLRGLIIALPNTHAQWRQRILAQTDGRTDVRIMDGSAAGRAEFEAFMKHEPGIYVAGSAYLRDKDWESRPQSRAVSQMDGSEVYYPLFKVDKKTGLMELKPRPEGMIGPAEEPVRVTKSVRTKRFARFHRKPLDFVVFDEVQAIANKRSRTRQTILSIKADYRCGMSGTWFLNKLENMWSVARWVWPGENPMTGLPYVETSHDEWRKRYLVFDDVRGRNGRVLETARGRPIQKERGERVPGEFVATLPAYVRREADPVPAPLLIEVDPLPNQRAQIEELKRDLMTWILDWEGEEKPLVADIPIVLKTRLRQAAIAELSFGEGEDVFMADDAESAKLQPLRWLIEERWSGQPVAIYTDSKVGAHFIARRMQRAGVDARAWTGDLTKTQRDEMKRSFLAGEFPYIIATVQSFGTGIDGFQWRTNKVAWVSIPQGDPALEDQAIRRIFRPGMTQAGGGFEQAVILMRDSTDVETYEDLVEQAWTVRTAMNGGQLAA